MPDALITKHGKYILLPNIRFAYGHEAIVSAIQNCQLRRDLTLLKDPCYKNCGQAITFLFKKDKKGWRVFVSTDVKPPLLISNKERGVIGLDINSDHLAVVETDRFGNPIEKYTFPLPLQNTTKQQTRAMIGDASKKIIALCEQAQKPLVLENLDFQKKKAQLRQKNKTYARMLSAFAYQDILTHLKSRGQSKGIQVQSVNPAFTSLIGRVNYAKRYGLSIHHAAALCIGRRFLGVSERMPQGQREIPDGKGGHVTLDLPVRNRSRHVWYQWGQLNKKLPAALTAHFRTEKIRSSSSCKATCEIFPNLVGGTPTRESSASLFC
jgi:IS605 OrfB family transposase